MAVLRNERLVSLMEASVHADEASGSVGADGKRRPTLLPQEQRLFDLLRALRKSLAAEKGVPPFVVFHDSTLEDVCARRPGSIDGLSKIKGLGTTKITEFGERLIAALNEHCPALELDFDATPASQPAPTASPAGATEQRKRSAGSHAAAALFDQGLSIEEVMQQTGRARSTVFQYLADYVTATRPESLGRWVPRDTYSLVAAAIDEYQATAPPEERGRLGPIYAKLDAKIGFEFIRLVMAHRGF